MLEKLGSYMQKNETGTFYYTISKNKLKKKKKERWVLSLGCKDPLGEEMATHSSIFAWRVPWTEEPGGLMSKGLQSWP